jgi:hypothetical protein
MESRMGWSAAWGVIAATFIGAAVAWFIAAVPTDSHLSVWPALGLALVGLVGIYCLFASQLSIWPFRHAPDRDVARAVFNSFEDRRVLYQAQNQLAQDFSGPIDPEERPDWCAESAIKIREFLTDQLNELGRGGGHSDIAEHLQAIRAACRKFVTEMGGDDRVPRERSSEWDRSFPFGAWPNASGGWISNCSDRGDHQSGDTRGPQTDPPARG